MPIPPTLRQREAARFIGLYIIEHDGVAPTQCEIAKGLELSYSAVNSLLRRMQDRGLIKRTRHWRSIELVSS